MATIINIDEITDEIKTYIRDKCIIKLPKTQYEEEKKFSCYRKDKDGYKVPLDCGNIYEEFPNDRNFSSSIISFNSTLYSKDKDPKGYRDQDIVVEKAITLLDKYNTVFLALPCGFGKTTIGVYLHSRLKLKTMIISHLDVVRKQWKECYEKKTNAKVQRINDKTKINPNVDVYIMGIEKASLINDFSIFHDIGILIIDEAHMAPITTFGKSILNFTPRYVIGMSATPDVRLANDVLDLYFNKTFIYRKEIKPFTVIKYKTNFRPQMRYINVKGKKVPDWTNLLNSLAYNPERQLMIVNDIIVPNINKHIILVLSNRIEECQNIYDLLIKILPNENISILTGKKDSYNPECKVLIAGMKKAGVGFNDERFTMLVNIFDIKDIRQYEGRIRTTNNIIYDVVDNFPSLDSHFELRRDWYESKGAIIKVKYERNFIESNNIIENKDKPNGKLLGPNKG